MASPNITIAICTYDRAELPRRSLESLLHLETDGRFNYAILVIDDASTDGTERVVSECNAMTDIDVRYVREDGHGISQARHRAVCETATEWIAFFDDDQLAQPDWLLRLVEFAAERSLRCVGGARHLELPAETLDRLSSTVRSVLGEMEALPHRCGRKPMLATGSVLIDRTVFDEVGNFDVTITRGGEDLDLFRRMWQADIEMWHVPASRCHHIIPSYRLEPKYLLWCSLRNGENMAHRDAAIWRGPRLLAECFLRGGQALGMFAPQWLLATATGRRDTALGYQCRIVRSIGYGRRCLQRVGGRYASQRSFSDRLSFRDERHTHSSPTAP